MKTTTLRHRWQSISSTKRSWKDSDDYSIKKRMIRHQQIPHIIYLPPPSQKKTQKTTSQLQKFMAWKIQPNISFREGLVYFQGGELRGNLGAAGTSNGFSDFPTLVGNTTETKVSVQFTASEAVGNAWIQILPSSDVSGETWESEKHMAARKSWGDMLWLGGGFKHFLFSPLFGEMIQFD